MKKRKAFTLIELLTVMAITAVLLTLIVLPVVQSFALTRAAQALADAQDKARLITDRIAREVGNAFSVRNAASTDVVLPGNTYPVRLPYTKLDLVPPAQGDAGLSFTNADGSVTYQDPDTGKYDPTLTRPKGDVNVNGLPGPTLVRYFVGVNRPLVLNADGLYAGGGSIPYNEPYTGLLMARNGGQDNLMVLRRAEVQPFVYRPRKDKAKNDTTTFAWRPNLAYFRSDDKVSDTQEFDTRIIDSDDPRFFVPDGMYLPEGALDDQAGTNRKPDAEKNNRVAHWAGLAVDAGSTSVDLVKNAVAKDVAIQTEVSRYDMIRPLVQGSPPQVVHNSDGTVSVVPLIQFRPTRVANEPATGSAPARPGEAVDAIDRIGPDTYKTDRGLWTDAFVRLYPGGYVPGSGAMEVASVDPTNTALIQAGVTDASGFDTPTGDPFFDLNAYEHDLTNGTPYPFSAATGTAALTASARAFFTPFRVLTQTGKIVTSFPIDQVGTAGAALPMNHSVNDPFVTNGSIGATSPDIASGKAGGTAADPNLGTAPYSPYGGAIGAFDVNRAYNRAYETYPDLQATLQRFIDLRFVPNADGTPSPLCPIATSGITGFTVDDGTGARINRVRIVPGSEEVYGADQNPGANYQNTVRYTRVAGNPGPNQYRIVYADLPEPTDPTTGQVKYDSLGLVSANGLTSGDLSGFDPKNYNASNVVSAVVQPRFKAGYLQLDSDPNVPLPQGDITVSYRFQLNGPSDTFAVDLDTREIMQILLTVKNYPQSSLPNAQTVTLKSTATLRNAIR